MISSLERIRKPSEATAKKLAGLFPATKPLPPKRSDVFDSLEDCVALPAQKKKKASKVKAVAVNVIVVSKSASLMVPKGKKRQKLVQERRGQKIQLKRTMYSREV